MEVYDRTKIGRCLSWAGDHFVFEYGIGEVIKFSKLNFLRGRAASQHKYLADYALCQKFLAPYLLETRVAHSPGGFLLALIQLKIDGEFLSAAHLLDPHVRHQFLEFLGGYEQLKKESRTDIDLVGNKGMFHRVLSNIFVTPKGDIVLFDAMLMSLEEFPWWSLPLMFPIFLVGRMIQHHTLSFFKKTLRCSLPA